MKTRIVIYVCLFLLVAVGLFYVTQRTQRSTGMATGRRRSGAEFQNVKIEKIKAWDGFIDVKVQGVDEEIELLYREWPDKNWIPVVLMAFQNQMPISCDISEREGKTVFSHIEIYAEDKTTNEDVVDEIKKVNNSINYVKSWLYWIWRYVYYTYRRVR